MKRKVLFGIYIKVLTYTLLILLVVIVVATLFLSNQITVALKNMEHQQLSNIFSPLIEQLDGKSDAEIKKISEEFYAKNAAFDFYVLDEKDKIIYRTPGAIFQNATNTPGKTDSGDIFYFGSSGKEKIQMSTPLPNGIKIFMSGAASGGAVYRDFIQKTAVVLLLLFITGGLTASVFAYRITKPIKILARDTKRMSELEFVAPPVARKDEIGQLAEDVYHMYEALKTEIEREREMEENQRYFFSAASHELKTPIASALILLQGMLDNIGEYKDHPKYLLECIKKMKAQSKMISEILEIVRLSDSRVIPNPEPIELSSAVSAVVSSHTTLTEARGQSVDVNVPVKLIVMADRNMLTRVLSNVFLNATQNTPEHGIIRLWEETREHSIRLCILNEGASLGEESPDKLFEPFYRQDKSRSGCHGRSGLGLAIVKKTLDVMGAAFSIENQKEGVLFWMDLPIRNE